MKSSTGKFISAVRWRILLIRIAECMAIATAVASATGLAVLPLAWWRGQSGLPMAAALVLLGIMCGLMWGISRRPTPLQAAVEADRQLDLHELLGTVLQLADSPAESAWQDSLAAFAENQCRSLKPSAIIVNRLGLRAWAGVGILAALLLTFAALTARPADVTAASASVLAYVPDNSMQPGDTALANVMNEESAQNPARPPGPGGTDDSNRAFPQNRPDDSNGGSVLRQNVQSHSSNGSSSSPGSGLVITAAPKFSPQWPQINSAGGDPNHIGRLAAGTGQSDRRATASGDTNSTMAAWASPGANPAPWTTPGWPADAAAAENSINAGQVPDTDADLVRDYFRRD